MTNTPQELRELIEVLDGPPGFAADLERLFEQHTAQAVAAALKEERVISAMLSDDSKIRRALDIAEQTGYEKAIKDREHLDALKGQQ